MIVYPDQLTDKELHELIQSVDESGYFDKPSAQAEEEEEDLVGDVCVWVGEGVCEVCGWGEKGHVCKWVSVYVKCLQINTCRN